MIVVLPVVAALVAMLAPVAPVAPVAVSGLASAPTVAATTCTAKAGAFTWGFKESFRAYISGSIANGEWTTAGGIGYATPDFSSDQLTGAVRLDALAGELAVDGSIRFTGHEGILDTTIADPRFVLDGSDRLVVVVDVIGTTQDFTEVDSADVPFLEGDLAAAEWRVDGDTLVLGSIPVTLTAAGAEAFGTYPAGEAFDPLTLEFTTTADCAAAAIESRAAADRLPLLVAAGVAIVGAALGGGIALLLRRRRRAASAPSDDDGAVGGSIPV